VVVMMGRGGEPARATHSPLIAVVLIAALAVTLAGIFPFRQILAQNRQVENTENKLAALQQENAVLEAQIDALNSDVELERMIREQLGMVAEGETGVTVEPAPGGEQPESAVPAVEFDDRGLVQKFWDFLTGRDLVPDG
jgi:cell division protein FtsB